MTEFDIVYKDIRLRIYGEERIKQLLKNHFGGHVFITEPMQESTYTLVITDSSEIKSGKCYRMVDKWFDNSSLDCYIDNDNCICYATNINANSQKNKDLLLQYFVANFFNRFLELYGYLGVHSACVEKDKEGVLFVAERYNGKTICMLNLMNNGYNIVTNDVIALKKINSQLIGYGIAQDVSIRLGEKFCMQPENQKYVELAKQKGIKIIGKDKIDGHSMHLTDLELAKLNEVQQSMDTPIKFIVRPCYDPYTKEASFERLSQEQLRELIYSQYRSLVHETTDFLINIKLNGIDEKERYNHLEDIIELPAYYCRQNENTTKQFVRKIEMIRKSTKN